MQKFNYSKPQLNDIKVNNISNTFLIENNDFATRQAQQQRNKELLGNFNVKVRPDSGRILNEVSATKSRKKVNNQWVNISNQQHEKAKNESLNQDKINLSN